jgi:hypothetical protein
MWQESEVAAALKELLGFYEGKQKEMTIEIEESNGCANRIIPRGSASVVLLFGLFYGTPPFLGG